MLALLKRILLSTVIICCIFLTINTSDAKETKYARWSKEHKPIKVFIENSPQVAGFKATYPQDVARAFSVWKSSTKGLVDFSIVKDKSQADIIVSWAAKLKKEDLMKQAKGHSYVWGVTKLGNPVRIILVTKHPNNDSQSLSDQNIFMISLHEIGHSLGIWWHTRDPKDIMYPEFLISSTSANGAKMISNQNRGTLSGRDIQNIISLYNNNSVTYLDKVAKGTNIEIASVNNSNLGAIETTGTAAASVASKSTKLNLNIGDAQAYLKKNPNSFEAYNNLGLIFMESGDFDQAVDNFNKAIQLNSAYPTAHFNLGLTFVKMKKFDAAIEEYKKYLELEPTATNSEEVKKEIIRLKQISFNSNYRSMHLR